MRHYGATTIWRRTGDLALVQGVLRHETLTMALRYVAVAQTDIAAKFRQASPMDHLWTERGSAVESRAKPPGRFFCAAEGAP